MMSLYDTINSSQYTSMCLSPLVLSLRLLRTVSVLLGRSHYTWPHTELSVIRDTQKMSISYYYKVENVSVKNEI